MLAQLAGTRGIHELTKDVTINIGPFQWVDLPKGTRTNFASIPGAPKLPARLKAIPVIGVVFRLLEALLSVFNLRMLIDPSANDIALAALAHDAIVGELGDRVPIKTRNYTSGNLVPIERYPTWREAARIFRGIMYDTKAPAWKRFLCYNGVRAYGIYSKKSFDVPTNGSLKGRH